MTAMDEARLTMMGSAERAEARKVARRAVVDAMIEDVRAGILVLASVYGMPVTHEIATDRANNIVCGLVSNYDVRALR